jgi:uncharacterized protein (TIRG00374 family)
MILPPVRDREPALDRLTSVKVIRGLIVSTIVAAAGYLGFSLWVGWHDVTGAFSAVGWPGLAAALGLSLMNYSLRFVRWQLYLSALGHKLPLRPGATIYFAGFALTTTPGKAGEMVRGVFLQAHGIAFIHTAAATLSERLSDLLAVVLLSLPGIFAYRLGEVVVIVSVVAISFFLILMSQGRVLIALGRRLDGHSSKLIRSGRHVVRLFLEARRCHGYRNITIATVLALLAWSAEAFAFYIVLDRMGIFLGVWTAMSIYALSTIAGALSFLPGGLGGAEAAMIALLMLNNVSEPTAVAATIVIRLATMWFAVALGAWVMIAGRQTLLSTIKMKAV